MQIYKNMVKTIIFSVLILAFCIAFMCITMLVKKNGRFPNTHVSGSKALRDRGITCIQSQDWAERHKKRGA